MKKRLLLSLLIFFSFYLHAQDRDMVLSKTKGKKVALVMGNSSYGGNADLKGKPRNDATDISSALRTLGFTVTTVYDQRLSAMKSSIRDFSRKSAGADVALFFYAGHGLQIKGENYLVPIGASMEEEWEAEDECMKANRLLSAMESSNAKVNLVILDACRNNPFTRGWNRSVETNGLSGMGGPVGSLIAFSTSPNDVAANGNNRNSPYTSSLLKHIKTPGIHVLDVFSNVRSEVNTTTNGKQTPWENNSIIGKLYLNGKTTTPTPIVVEADSDGDGFPDKYDKCPNTYGSDYGCPEETVVIKKDSDGDGYDDDIDDCDYEYSRTNNGCPEEEESPMPSNMVFVKGGTFQMGCTSEQGDCNDDEKSVRSVTVSDYYIGKYEVTQQEWRELMGSNPSKFSDCDSCPVEQVSWEDIQEYIKKLNTKHPGMNYRLPTEAEWEYASRGGNKSRGYKYSGSNSIGDVAWYKENSFAMGENHSNYGTNPVGTKKSNELGIYDMTGNVWEWCSDWYTDDYSSISSTYNPKGASSGSSRVFRGGSWFSSAGFCRVSLRDGISPGFRHYYLGFRLAHS